MEEFRTSQVRKNMPYSNIASLHNDETPKTEEHLIDDRNTLSKLVDWWLLELLACLLSLSTSAGLVGLLWHFDGRALPSFPSGISLNSILAIFTTVAKAGLLIPIAEAIGQLKWIYFAEKKRPLSDLQTFDEASRGISGSLKLIGRLKGGHLACLGALVSILGLGTSFITQQMIAYPTRMVSDQLNTSVALRADMYWSYKSQRTSGAIPDNYIKQALLNGLYNPVNISITQLPPTCSSGNCTWARYSSLEICSNTADVSAKLNYTPTDTVQVPDPKGNSNSTLVLNATIALPNKEFYTSDTEGRLSPFNFTSQRTANKSISFLDIPNIHDIVIVNSFLIYKDDRNDGTSFKGRNGNAPLNITHSAIETILYWCVKSHNQDQVLNGVPRLDNVTVTTEVRTTHGDIFSPSGGPDSKGGLVDPGEKHLVLASGKDDLANYTVEGKSQDALQRYMLESLQGTAQNQFGVVTSATGPVMMSALYDASDAANMTKGPDRHDLQYKAIDTLFSNIATSMSNNVRIRKFRGEPAHGESIIAESYVHVRWEWLTYLLTLLALSFTFLIMTIYKTKESQVKVLKSSALAVMYGSTDKSKDGLHYVADMEIMQQKAKKSNVMLVRSEGGWRLE